MAEAELSDPPIVDDANTENANPSNTEPKRKSSIPQRKARITKIKQPSTKPSETSAPIEAQPPSNGPAVEEKSVVEENSTIGDVEAAKDNAEVEQTSPRGVRRGRGTKVIKKPPPDLAITPSTPVVTTDAPAEVKEVVEPVDEAVIDPANSNSSDQLFSMSNSHDLSALQPAIEEPVMKPSLSQASVGSKQSIKSAVGASEELAPSHSKASLAEHDDKKLAASERKTSIASDHNKETEKKTAPATDEPSVLATSESKASIASHASKASLSKDEENHDQPALTTSDSKTSVASNKSVDKKLAPSDSKTSVSSDKSKASKKKDTNSAAQEDGQKAEDSPTLIASRSKASIASNARKASISKDEENHDQPVMTTSDSKISVASNKSVDEKLAPSDSKTSVSSDKSKASKKKDTNSAAHEEGQKVEESPTLIASRSKASIASHQSNVPDSVGDQMPSSASRASISSIASKHEVANDDTDINEAQESRLKTPDALQTIAVEVVHVEDAVTIPDVIPPTATVDVIPVETDDSVQPRAEIAAATPPPVEAPPVEAPAPQQRGNPKSKKSKPSDPPAAAPRINKKKVGDDVALPAIKAKPRPPPEERQAVNPRQNRILKAAAAEAENNLPDIVGKKVKNKRPVMLPPMEQRVVESAPLIGNDKSPKLTKEGSNSAENSPVRKKVKKKHRRPLYVRLMAEGLKKQNQWEKEKMEKYAELKQKKVQPSKAEIDAHMAKYRELRKIRLENEEEQARILKNEWKRKQKELKKMEYAAESPLKQLVVHSEEARANKDQDDISERKQRVDKGKEYANIVRDLFQPPPPLVKQASNGPTPRKKLKHDLEVALQEKEELLTPVSPMVSPVKPPKKESPIHRRIKYERQNSNSPRAQGQDWINELMGSDPEEPILAEMYETGFAMLMVEKGIISASR